MTFIRDFFKMNRTEFRLHSCIVLLLCFFRKHAQSRGVNVGIDYKLFLQIS